MNLLKQILTTVVLIATVALLVVVFNLDFHYEWLRCGGNQACQTLVIALMLVTNLTAIVGFIIVAVLAYLRKD